MKVEIVIRDSSPLPRILTTTSYTVAYSTAPQAYDGDGVVNIVSTYDDYSRPARLILIPDFSLEWQKGRNSSGLHTLTFPANDGLESRIAARILLELTKGAKS